MELENYICRIIYDGIWMICTIKCKSNLSENKCFHNLSGNKKWHCNIWLHIFGKYLIYFFASCCFKGGSFCLCFERTFFSVNWKCKKIKYHDKYYCVCVWHRRGD